MIESKYGYRPKRSAHDAIERATIFMRKHKLEYVEDMDLPKCFDRLDHGIIIDKIQKRVRDGSVINLIKQFLQSGVVANRVFNETIIGSPQGGVIQGLTAYFLYVKIAYFLAK